jgi:hypothetical protein
MGADDVEVLQARSAYHPTAVQRHGDIVLRDARPWTPSVHALLRHLESRGFEAAPRVVGSGFDDEGREMLTYIEGHINGGRPPWETGLGGPTWTMEACLSLGALLRQAHDCVRRFEPPPGSTGFAWSGEEMGEGPRIIGHRDPGPWNIIARNRMPMALIDWERAGPVDPIIDLALLTWLNADLFDDIVAERMGLPPAEHRARQVRAILDGYEMTSEGRKTFVDRLVEVAVHSVAEEADEFDVRHETRTQDVPPEFAWAVAWRARSAAWIMKHRRVLEAAL